MNKKTLNSILLNEKRASARSWKKNYIVICFSVWWGLNWKKKRRKKIQIPLAGSHCACYQDLNEYLTELCGKLYKLTKKNCQK
jgi:hypothetical protein